MRIETCTQCGKKFESNTSSKVCPECRKDHSCPICGKMINWRKVYCSRECAREGYKLNEVAHKKISESRKGVSTWERMTPEQREASNAKRQQTYTEEWRAKRSAQAKEKMTSELRSQISEKMTKFWEGNNVERERRSLIQHTLYESGFGDVISELTRKALSDPEVRQKMSEAQIARWEEMSDEQRKEFSILCSEVWTDEMRKEAADRTHEYQSNLTDVEREAHREKKLSYWTPERRAEQAESRHEDVEAHERAAKTLREFWRKLSEEERAKRVEHLLFCGDETFSKEEQELFLFVKSLLPNTDVVQGDRTVLEGKELDIFIPSMSIAVEYHGMYWHCDLNKDKRAHYEKYGFCKRKGVRLLQIWECDWINSRSKVEALLRSVLGVSERIGARECEAMQILPIDKDEFLNANHMQGADRSFLSVGLLKDREIKAVMTFRRSRDNKEVELSRYCGEVVGGFSKLLKYATPLLKESGITELTSYSDNMVFSGDVYEKTGWELVDKLPPDYKVFFRGNLYHKSSWRKSSIIQRFPDFENSGMTEWQMEDAVGALRVWDAGKKKWRITL